MLQPEIPFSCTYELVSILIHCNALKWSEFIVYLLLHFLKLDGRPSLFDFSVLYLYSYLGDSNDLTSDVNCTEYYCMSEHQSDFSCSFYLILQSVLATVFISSIILNGIFLGRLKIQLIVFSLLPLVWKLNVSFWMSAGMALRIENWWRCKSTSNYCCSSIIWHFWGGSCM